MNTPDALPPQWPVPTAPPTHNPALFARAMRDMRLTWRARGVLAELATGYTPGQEPTVTELVSLTRDERLAAEGRDAFRKAVGELRSLGYLSPDATTASGVGERLVVDLAPAAAARLIPQRYGHSPFTDGS
ncbi:MULTISPECIES: hypothetical protein [Streptomyces]|uniref:Uncharacterized protein n=1 Tax=Streptomyces fradiae ATCC 10745 = DSM 40063 TaxID=1319510 RepID=A0A1Y2NUJ1_STRFR|nr:MULTISPECIES: hypothetical protein [Streptomyces]KAF0646858.1 hypothetical protein K701_26535 [Streptomyces fradiae ATCC 10745 = DSM 40063]OSY49651.1 hypothetical protein BG846_04791 [Streptomyces fradiae ATCC 10745 = DSM 40063]OSY51100.1 hypothetical protein BG846_03198 [Streptomyces fradiae ATCC 10745 = DSM 40063]OSY51194.1 hypothetical protein BG846_03176 [Streptomyces fradiae ATCC 10745 = DSM 40063]QEV10681.1 hypothetical protein CP974_00080 [Streptomyces fradiae ATCC 10745 = DSM 40063]